MKRIIFFRVMMNLLVVLALMPGDAFARDPQAVQIAQAAFNALGGAQALSSILDTQANAAITYFRNDQPIQSGSLLIKSKGLWKMRMALTLNGALQQEAIFNTGVGGIIRQGQSGRLPTHNTFAQYVSHLPLFSILAEYNQPSIDALYFGTTTIGTRQAYVIELVKPTLPFPGLERMADYGHYRLFIDTVTSLVLRIAYFRVATGNVTSRAIFEDNFSNYQQVNQMQVPFTIDHYRQGRRVLQILIQNISTNVGLSDSDFIVP